VSVSDLEMRPVCYVEVSQCGAEGGHGGDTDDSDHDFYEGRRLMDAHGASFRGGGATISIGRSDTDRLPSFTTADRGDVAGHSLRVGFATAVARAGRSEAAIMRHGRWKSAQIARRYISQGARRDDNPAAKLL
jgi:hypothetical protein